MKFTRLLRSLSRFHCVFFLFSAQSTWVCAMLFFSFLFISCLRLHVHSIYTLCMYELKRMVMNENDYSIWTREERKKNTSMAQIHNLFGTCERFSETLKTETCIHILTCDGHNWALSYLVYFSYLNNFYFIIWFYFKIIRSIQCVQSWVVNLFTRALRIYMRECVYMKIAKTREEKKNKRTHRK